MHGLVNTLKVKASSTTQQVLSHTKVFSTMTPRWLKSFDVSINGYFTTSSFEDRDHVFCAPRGDLQQRCATVTTFLHYIHLTRLVGEGRVGLHLSCLGSCVFPEVH